MRPPMKKWWLTANAVRALYEVIVALALKETNLLGDKVALARVAVEAIEEHVDNAEECETP